MCDTNEEYFEFKNCSKQKNIIVSLILEALNHNTKFNIERICQISNLNKDEVIFIFNSLQNILKE